MHAHSHVETCRRSAGINTPRVLHAAASAMFCRAGKNKHAVDYYNPTKEGLKIPGQNSPSSRRAQAAAERLPFLLAPGIRPGLLRGVSTRETSRVGDGASSIDDTTREHHRSTVAKDKQWKTSNIRLPADRQSTSPGPI